MEAPPIRDAYWVRPGRLLAGGYPGAWREDQTRRRLRSLLLQAGFDDLRLAVVAVSTQTLPPQAFVRMVLAPVALDIDPQDLPPEVVERALADLEHWGKIADAFGVGLATLATGQAP